MSGSLMFRQKPIILATALVFIFIAGLLIVYFPQGSKQADASLSSDPLVDGVVSPEAAGMAEISDVVEKDSAPGANKKTAEMSSVGGESDSESSIESSIDIVPAVGQLERADEPQSASGSQQWFVALAVIAFLALLVSIFLNVMLLKWRRSVEVGTEAIIPSNLLGIVEGHSSQQVKKMSGLINQQASFMKELEKVLNDVFSRFLTDSGETKSSVLEMLQSFSSLQNALKENDKEIDRLRQGYDYEVYKRFIGRFIRLQTYIGEEIDDISRGEGEALQSLKEMHEVVQEALANAGLVAYTPEVGEGVQESDGLDENYKLRPADQPEQILTIAEVIEPGWYLNTPDGIKYVKKARVAVYVENEEVA